MNKIKIECEFIDLKTNMPCHNRASHKVIFKFAEKYICYNCLCLRQRMLDKLGKKTIPLKIG